LRKLQAERGGLGVDAVAAADGECVLVLPGALLEGGQQQVEVFQQQVGGAHQLHVEAGVQHVRRGHALVHEARFRADDFGQVRQEGDDVVLHFGLDGVDARHVELGIAGLVPYGLRCVCGDHAKLGLRVRRVRLDLEPDAELLFRRPDGGHFGPGIAGDHVRRLVREGGSGCDDWLAATAPPLNPRRTAYLQEGSLTGTAMKLASSPSKPLVKV
jgi:hypothetical protein